MSRDIDNIIKEIAKSNKQIYTMDNHLSKDINELKRSLKTLESKIKTLDAKMNQALDILATFTVLMTDQDDDEIDSYEEDSVESENWNPYDIPEDYDNDDNEEDE